MQIREATAKYEAWLASQIPLIHADLKSKREQMREGIFAFLRATFYRWTQVWPEVCGEVAEAPVVLAVGDLHVENFGTWRDAEGRLVWGINDFDEAWPLAYTNDLVRLAASAYVAIEENGLTIEPTDAARGILEGYAESLDKGGRPYVLADEHPALRAMAMERLKDPQKFWHKMEQWAELAEREIPIDAEEALRRGLPEPGVACRVVHRVSGLGSLGRQRFVALAEWRGGKIAREAKAMAPSACLWAQGGQGAAEILYQKILDSAVRCPDPFVRLEGRWVLRRLAPDCSRIELAVLPKEKDAVRLLRAMGFETANVHLGSGNRAALAGDLQKREPGWLHHAAKQMVEAVRRDWGAFKG
ncbi:MAG: DUF2252 family protein [Acidobacteria bacterium]|nr:DUF2252 family protein [Acidobacteriota bacterium]